MKPLRHFRRPADDTGASLPLVLAFVTGVGVLAAATLSYTGGSLTSLESTTYRAHVDYDVDGSLKTAVNQIRQSSFVNGTVGTQSCGRYLNDKNGESGASTFLSYDGGNGRQVAVTCEGGPKTGLDGGPSGVNDDNRPDFAVLTLDDGDDGWHMQVSGAGKKYKVNGDVYVNSNPSTNPATVLVEGDFTARGPCENVEADAKDCKTGNAKVPDPGQSGDSTADYDQPVGGFQYRQVPACPAAPATTVKLSPGYYDDARALEVLTKGGCATAHTVWFQPGVYYFDFRNGMGSPYADGNRTWSISDGDVRVIAGTPLGWNEATGYTGAAANTAGACVNPLDTVDSTLGATFVFGGDSQLDATGGRFEICGSYSPDKPPFAIYGATTAIAGSTDSATALWDSATAATPSGHVAYLNPGGIATDDSSEASAAVAAGITKNTPAAITLPDLTAGLSIPAGAKLTVAELIVDHRVNLDAGTANKVVDPTVTLTPAGGSALDSESLPKHVSDAGDFKRTTLDVRDALDDTVHGVGLTGLQIEYAQTVDHNSTTVTSYIEYASLSLTWESPSFTAQSNSTAPQILHGPTPFTGPAPATGLFVRGMTYAPRSTVYVDLGKDNRATFTWGLVAKGLKVKTYGNTLQPSTVPLFGLPGDVYGPDVYFKAYRYQCPNGATTCDVPSFPAQPAAPDDSWKLAGSARVNYDDGYDIASPVAGARATTVQSWTVYR